MIGTLVIVALVVTATSGKNVMEFSEEALQTARNVDSTEIQAELINPSTKITLQRKVEYLDQVITFVPEEPSNSQEQETLDKKALSKPPSGGSSEFDCGNLHGIYIAGAKSPSCKISQVNMIAGTKQKSGGVTVDTFRFSILFEDRKTETLRLDIPVLQAPSAVVSLDQQQRNKWAKDKRVGIVTPIKGSTLTDIIDGWEISIDFVWLSDLLQLGGVFKLADFKKNIFPLSIPTYVTRPIVLPKKLISNYFEVVDHIDDESDGTDEEDEEEEEEEEEEEDNMQIDDTDNMQIDDMQVDDSDNMQVD